MFQLLRPDDESCLPATALFQQLSRYDEYSQTPVTCDWHVLVPRPLDPSATGLFPADLVRRFPPKSFDDLVGHSAQTMRAIVEKRGYDLERVEFRGEVAGEPHVGLQWLRYKNASDCLVSVFAPTAEANPIALMRALVKCGCNWPKHFATIALIKRTS